MRGSRITGATSSVVFEVPCRRTRRPAVPRQWFVRDQAGQGVPVSRARILLGAQATGEVSEVHYQEARIAGAF